MISKRVQRLIAKYLNKQATLIERDELEHWLENKDNYALFKEYVKTNFFTNVAMNLYDANDTKKKLLDLIKKEKKVHRLQKFYRVMRYAAVLTLIVGLGYLFNSGYFQHTTKVTIPSDSITLQLENGNIQIISENGSSQVVDANGSVVVAQKGNQLIYNDAVEKEELVYNTLTVPFGKRFEVQLSDGTNIHLNAGTSIKYPVKFLAGQTRQVFLTGEAFFEVAKDSANAFVVNANTLNVEVLGTEFNVSAYPEDPKADVVLVEGSVGMYSDNQHLAEGIKIVPGVMGSFDVKSRKITTEHVDTTIYTSWREGALVFRNMAFKNIVSKLERHFNMKIIIDNEKLNDEVFSASFKQDSSIDRILNSFGKSYGIKYTIENNAIHIN